MAEQDLVPIVVIGAVAAAAGIGAAILLSQPAGAAVPTFLTISVTPTNVAINQPVAVTGKLTQADTGAGLPSQSIVVEESPDQTTWHTVTTVQTAADGTYSTSITFTAAGTYYVRTRFAGA